MIIRAERWLRWRMTAMAAALLLLAGCATRPVPEAVTPPGEADPLEAVNRSMFTVHYVVDRVLLAPMARVYRRIPSPVTGAVSNFFETLEQPVVVVNAVMQGKPRVAQESMERFLTNSLLGCGFFDAASAAGIPLHDEDFGQTLAVWGVGSGPYLFVPVIGPMNLRDGAGRLADGMIEPGGDAHDTLRIAGQVWKGIGFRARNLENFETLERTSLDLYATLRSIYYQQRQAAINDGKPATPQPSDGGGADDASYDSIFEQDYGL